MRVCGDWAFQQVHKVFPNGLASQEGTIQKGDEVLSINGKSLKGATHNDASAILRQARQPRQAVVVTRKAKNGEKNLNVSINSSTSSVASDASQEFGKFSGSNLQPPPVKCLLVS